jgi:hypothetical protein
MNRILGLVLLTVLITLGSLGGYGFTQRVSASSAVDLVAELHAENEGIEEHLDRYQRAMRTVGAPFRAIDSLSGLLERVEQARGFTVEVGGAQIQPWRSVEAHTPGAEILDVALSSAGDVVRLGSVVDSECAALEEAAATYAGAWETAQAERTDESVIALSAAAETLSVEIASLRDRVSPASDALGAAVGEIDEAREWLDGITPDGARESLVLAGIKAAVGVLRAAASEPYDAVDGLTGAMEADIATLQAVAAMDDQLRSVFWASLTP